MSQRLYVVASEGRSVPLETPPGMIEGTPVVVLDSHYYRRRIADGELQVLEPPEPEVDPSAEAGRAIGDAIMGAVAEGIGIASAPAAADAVAPITTSAKDTPEVGAPDTDHPTSRRRPAP